MEHDRFYHARSIEDLFRMLDTSEKGLHPGEAAQRRKEHGRNELETREKKSLFSIFISQVKNPVIYLLVAAVIVSFVFRDFPEAIAIMVVIVLNTSIGFWMEYKAQSSLEALKKLDPLKVSVIRQGAETAVNAEELVPGDLISLEAGDLVPADARIIAASELGVDESPLTGESLPVFKQTDPLDESVELAEQSNMLFKGTAVTTGKAKAVVVATGMKTEIGKISRMVSEETSEEVPLNKKLGKLARRLIWVISGLSLLFFVFGWIAGKELYVLLQTAIAWTVAAIPEGLPIVATISLARGMLRLSRKNVLVRNLSAVETLGETTVILTDKTGTITQNSLSLTSLLFTNQQIESLKEHPPEQDEAFGHFFSIAMLCNDASKNGDAEENFQGDPLDKALLEFGIQHNEKGLKQLRNLPRIQEDPFDSDAMFMGTIHEKEDGCYIAAKGATSAILDRCSHYLDQGKTIEMDDEFDKQWRRLDQEQSARGLKVIGFAFREVAGGLASDLKEREDFVENMVFVGMAGFFDPVREDIKEPLELCRQAGIRILMVTGDHPETARQIADEVNLRNDNQEKVVHGKELEKTAQLSAAAVFARVDPSQKLNIVNYFQEQGEIVGMTGDGVNDAPALKKADIGIAMGQRGTQVARDVADMVLQDDAFSSIVKAIELGRVIFQNIKKFIIYQLSYHLAEIIIIAGISFTMFQLPLLPLQLLFLNLLSDVFPALALGVGKGSRRVMEDPPKDPKEPIMTRKDWYSTGIYGGIIATFVIAAYVVAVHGMHLSDEVANNIAFFSLAFSQLLHVFNMRDPEEPVFNNQVTRNPYIWMALAFCILILLAAYFILPLSEVLSFQDLPLKAWALILLTGFLPLLTIQWIKRAG